MDIAATAQPEYSYVKSLVCAGLMTFSLLYFMHLLIDTGTVEAPVYAPPIAPIVAVKETIEEIKKEPKPTPPEEAVEPPPVAPREVEKYTPIDGGFTTGLDYRQPQVTRGSAIKLAAGGLVQQVMVAPTYPSRALTRGIEGYVDVQFEVTAMGSTQQVVVLRSDPEGVFERAAMRAVKRWKYLPDEERTQAETLQERIRFAIEK
ncbi:MAG: energy transducer TonB [Cellvibrionaceae bacterium]